MPRKKLQHKGKPKHAVEESEDFAFRENPNENDEEEYVSVVDFETNRKYSKRFIESNWSKYETSLTDFDDENDENFFPRTSSFSDLVKTASSDCSGFEFNSEKLWKSEPNPIPASKIFNLDLNVLSSGLACVPFYKRLGLDEKELSVEEKENFDREAENSWKDYNAVLEKLVKKVESDLEIKNLDDSSETLENLKIKSDSENGNQNNKDIRVTEMVKTSNNVKDQNLFQTNQKNVNEIEESKQKIFFSEEDENLEDWLDSVLDD